MKVEIVAITAFTYPVTLFPGDQLKVTHTYETTRLDGSIESNKRLLSQDNIPETVTWTHSLLFKLNGVLNHIIGDEATIAWLEGQAS